MTSLLRQLGSRLKQLREAHAHRTADVSQWIGKTPQYINMIERGEANPTLEVLERLAVVLQVDLADLFAFPERTKLRHRARELIRLTPNAKLGELVAGMERVLGMTYEQMEEQLPRSEQQQRATTLK